MWQELLLGLGVGLLGMNAIPHLVKGVTKEPFPTPFGGSPVANVLGGWLNLVGALACAWGARDSSDQGVVWASAAVGVLAMGLFHARFRAFGRID